MNPPSAIHSAMSRERKPFTYTPGGLDLSEIKSERMAKRLMRNAMNQGIPEKPAHTVQSPSISSTPIAVPNFNCLPVQVFPTFNLPANPKSLLRTRSNPDQPRDTFFHRVPPQFQSPSVVKPTSVAQSPETMHVNTPTYSHVNNNKPYNNNRPTSMFEYSSTPTTVQGQTVPRISYGSNGQTEVLLPEISYEAEYFNVVPKKTDSLIENKPILSTNFTEELKPAQKDILENIIIDKNKSKIPVVTENILVTNLALDQKCEVPFEDLQETEDKQKEVKVVKKQVKKEAKVETGTEQNGDANVEAEVIVKLPTKKSGAKTETKVEVLRKILPDGTVEEVKTTTTKTTFDGKTEITTKTETRTLPKEEADEVVEVEEEEEEEVEDNNEVTLTEVCEPGEEDTTKEPDVKTKKTVTIKETSSDEENKDRDVIKKEEKSDTTTIKKVVIVQNTTNNEQESEEEEVEEEEEEEIEEIEPIIKQSTTATVESEYSTEKPKAQQQESQEEKEEEVEEEEEEVVDEKIPVKTTSEPETKEESEEEVEEDYEEEEETEVKDTKIEKDSTDINEENNQNSQSNLEEKLDILEKSETQEEEEKPVQTEKQDDESEYTEEEIVSEQEDVAKIVVNQQSDLIQKETEKQDEQVQEEESKESEKVPVENIPEKLEESHEKPQQEINIPIKEPSVPLEKVEDIEIKPIRAGQDYLTKSHTESTEIKTSSNEKPLCPLSTQTEYNRIENIITVNRTTKTLDHSYEQLTQQGIPTVKTYFPPTRERVSVSPSKPYQPVYTPEPKTERRHSLLLERLSTERQLPTSDIYQNTYQYNNQNMEQQRQWSQEPQSEVLTVSNVKPSTISNSQWYQQSKKENVIYNNITENSTPQWSQPQQPLPPKQPQSQQTYQPQTQLQPSYTESITRDSTNITSNIYQQNNLPSYTPKPHWNSNVDTVPTASVPSGPGQYSYLNQDSSKPTQQYSSTYVPPPWEQDSSYIPDYNQNYYQAPSQPQPTPNAFSPSINPGWNTTTTPQQSKFSKPKPTSYVPPAPNQSFVKPVIVEPPNQPGRKTYYSEYERRYITVPESTYIPTATKFQPQPDPSPQYYYDNNEPAETVEHQWRKELREFTEKTSQTQYQTEQTFAKPPWEEDSKYAKTQTSTYTPTPTWSQTLRPRSGHERSFESEYVGSQEWPKSSTLGRSRPMSTYVKSAEAPIPERVRGVSVDRYNPNNYQSPIPSEHPPVQSHTLTAPQAKNYHNPNVPAYHTRASAEPREQPVSHQQPRKWGESRASPIQSRSFKYLQWITGTDN